MKIKAIIFDWGGVLIDNPAPNLMAKSAENFGIEPEEYTKAHKIYEAEFQKGVLEEEKFWSKLGDHLGKQPKKSKVWKDAFISGYSPKKEIFELAAKLKKSGYKVGFLSNTEEAAMEFFLEQSYDMFHETIFSCAVGMVKPNADIFIHALDKLKVKPQEAVFIDDNPIYLEGAKSVGINIILFESPDQVKKELREKYSIKGA